MNNIDFVVKVMKYLAQEDLHSDVLWTPNLKFAVLCNDTFYPAADSEWLTEENFHIFEQSIKDIGNIRGSILFCARIRKLRPRSTFYDSLKEHEIPFFNDPILEINKVW